MEAGVSHVSFSLRGVYCDSRRCCTPLLINGLVVTGTTDLNVSLLQDMCEAWLSERPEVKHFIGCLQNFTCKIHDNKGRCCPKSIFARHRHPLGSLFVWIPQECLLILGHSMPILVLTGHNYFSQGVCQWIHRAAVICQI